MSSNSRRPQHKFDPAPLTRCRLVAGLAILCATVACASAAEQAPSQSPYRPVSAQSNNATAIATLDGRSVNSQISPSQQKSTNIVIADLNPPRTSKTKIRLWLPAAVLDGRNGDYTLKLSSQRDVTDNLIVDPAGEWYRFTRYIHAHRLSLTIEGDAHLLPQTVGCKTLDDATANIGSTEPQGRPSAATKRTHIGLEEGGDPAREVLFVRDCVAYRIIVECPEDSPPPKCKDALQKRLNGFDPGTVLTPVDDETGQLRKMLQVDNLRTLNVPGLRALRSNREDQPIVAPATRNGSAYANTFAFVEPGQAVYRQYLAPKGCTLAEPIEPTVLPLKSPYARYVFAPPDLMKRFPIALKAGQNAFANSQIFTQGGEFLLKAKPTGDKNVSAESLKDVGKRCPAEKATITAAVGERGDPINFAMPWTDTFCEWRGNSWHQAFCRYGGRAAKGPHYGVDIRSTTEAIDALETVVSVSDGVVVEVSGSGISTGHAVKVRSKHLVFVYRHMLPAHSPFQKLAPRNEPRLQLGDRVAAGEVLGRVGNYMGGVGGTTKHLHFEMEAPLPKSILLGSSCLVQRDDGQQGYRI